MAHKILLILTSHTELGSTGSKTGSWLEELAQPYYAFKEAGCAVWLASMKGGAAPIDPMSLGEGWISPVGQRFVDDKEAQYAVANTKAVKDVSAQDFDACFVVGGVGGAWDFPGNRDLLALLDGLAARTAIIGAVCHGAVALADVKMPDGLALVRGRNVTSVSNAEEIAVGFDKIVPILPEEALKRACGYYSAAPPFAAHVVQSDFVFTGQNPASALPLAQAMLRKLGASA
ncbi:MAG: type 1 glutamine amidotransferase domain-containing protein [Hyphomonadaceae bacterium JAD_PAG50586_4]|nr:MAG: type 1 glutamine amidotransferase domain-containing protein [Hyphomonadaceae bacterium JAD_PAG50586_4]